MGHQSSWLAFTGEHDDEHGHATLVLAHAPKDDHTGAGGTHAAHWFARSEGYPGVAPSFAFHRELLLEPGHSLVRRYRVLVADGAADEEGIGRRRAQIPW